MPPEPTTLPPEALAALDHNPAWRRLWDRLLSDPAPEPAPEPTVASAVHDDDPEHDDS